MYDPLYEKDAITFDMHNPTVSSLARRWIKSDKRYDYTLFKGFKNSLIKQETVFSQPVHYKDKEVYISDHYGIQSTFII